MVEAYYNNTHTCGNTHNIDVEAVDLSSWDKTINSIAKQLHSGKLKPSDLDPFLVTQTFSELQKGAKQGYGKDWLNFKDAKAVQKINGNLYLFSGVKTYQQLTEMNSFLVDKNGKIRNYEAFKREVFKVHKKYNKNYLQAEYNTAKASAQMAKQWQIYQADDNCTHLKYKTVGDDKVRDEHEKLNNTVKHKNDPFWDTYLPLNGWNCRCYVVCTKSDVTPEKKYIEVDKRFQNNVGKTNTIFNEKHPYFQIPKAERKQVETMLEHWKLEYPQYAVSYKAKNGAKVVVSAFADVDDWFGNYRAAIKMAKKGVNVKLRPHVLIDGVANPEYEIFDLISDRFEPKKKRGILSSIYEKATHQGVKSVVIDLTYKFTESRHDAGRAIKGAIKENSKIKEVILIHKNDVLHLTRKQILSSNFWGLIHKKSN